MRRILFTVAIALFVTLGSGGVVSAAPTEKDKKLLAEVSAKLVAVAEKPEGFEWPPDFGFESDGGINAYATFMRKDDKRYPIIRVTEGMMEKVIKGDADRLAFIVGHELGHILKGHVIANPKRDKTPFLKATFGRDEEVEADLIGFGLLLKAGYSLEKGMKAITTMQDQRLDYSSFEGLGKDHPSWNDRAAKADKDKAELWKAAAAFHNGVLFLATENYDNAIAAFKAAKKEFPKNYQVLNNLGYAQLMAYSDKWDKRDFQAQGIGQVVVGGFYNRLDEPVRGKDTELWFEAVGNLREANELKPGQTIILENLGLAYLLHPKGKDLKEANKFFAEAIRAAEGDKSLDPAARASLLINTGVATLADGQTEMGLAKLDEGERVVRSFAGPAAKTTMIDSAILYNRALVLADKTDKADKEKAFAMLEKYLLATSQLSLWWDSAYTRYTTVCKALEMEPKSKAAFKKDRPEPVRLVTGITVKDGKITLGQQLRAATKTLGAATPTTAIPGTSMVRVRYEKDGIELLATDEVVAIILSGPNAPAIPLTGKIVGTGKVGELKVGMTTKEMESLLGEDYQPTELTAAEVYYRFYREQGVAVRVSKGKVVELVVVQATK